MGRPRAPTERSETAKPTGAAAKSAGAESAKPTGAAAKSAGAESAGAKGAKGADAKSGVAKATDARGTDAKPPAGAKPPATTRAPGRSKPYHHGDLRRALIDAAVALVAAEGYRALTLREVARRAGVSHAAPYWHFKDRDELLVAAAEEGFAALCEAMTTASARAHAGGAAKLTAIGRAYVRFALGNEAYFRLMFGPLAAGAKPAEVATPWGRRAFEILLEHVAACQRDGAVRGRDPLRPALSAWSTVHGLATLLVDGRVAPLAAGAAPPDLDGVVDFVVRSIVDGIGAAE